MVRKGGANIIQEIAAAGDAAAPEIDNGCYRYAVKSAYARYNRGLENQRLLLKISSADEQEIEGLRDQKETWQQITDLKTLKFCARERRRGHRSEI